MLNSTSTSSHTTHGLLRKRSRSGLTFRSRNLLALAFALVYALGLASLPLFEFRDRDNYLIYAVASDVILERYLNQGIASVLANEPVWLLINMALSSFMPPDAVLATIIGVPAFVTAWLVLRSKPQHFVWLVLFLLYPGVVKNYIIHLRQGLAIAIFLMGWFSSRRSWRWLLIGVTPFIHASFFFVIVILLLAEFSRRIRLSANLSLFIFTTATVVMILSLQWAASSLGARQASQYDLSSGDVVSGVNFVFWLAMLLLMVFQGRAFLRQHRFVIGSIVLYLGTYFFIPITARVFESVLLLVLVSGLDLTGWRGYAFRFSVLGYGALQWASGIALASLLLAV